MRANNNLGQTHRPVTEKLHLRYDSDTSLRLTAAAHRQTTAYNRTVRDLWDHPGTPLQTSAAEGDVGLYTHLLAWREDTPELQLETTPSALARGGIAEARAAMAAFDESLERDTDRIIKTVTAAEKRNAKLRKLIEENPDEARRLTAEKLEKEQLARKPLKPWHDKKLHYERQGNIVDGIEQPVWTHGPIPRSIQKRTITLERLLRNQAEVDRAGRNLIRINEKPRRVDAHTIQIPGIGRINVREKIPETWDLRSINAVEVTHRRPDVHLAEAHERTWEIHVQHRIPAPLRVTEETIADETAALASVGADGGLVHDLTTNSTETGVRHHSPSKGRETPDGEQSSEELIKASQKHRRGCRQGSRKYRRLLGQENKIRGRAIRLRDHAQTELANSIAEVHDIVAIEDLQLANMTKSAEGTSESPGANTAAKRGLNRGFAGVAPGRQAAENKAACIRRGSVYQYVHPGGTSITCSECGKNAKESRLSQSEFCCVGCNYTASADANAAENIRMRGLARVRASARRRIEKRKKKRAESTVRSTEPRPGNGGAAGGNSAAAPYANGTGRCRESRCRGPG